MYILVALLALLFVPSPAGAEIELVPLSAPYLGSPSVIKFDGCNFAAMVRTLDLYLQKNEETDAVRYRIESKADEFGIFLVKIVACPVLKEHVMSDNVKKYLLYEDPHFKLPLGYDGRHTTSVKLSIELNFSGELVSRDINLEALLLYITYEEVLAQTEENIHTITIEFEPKTITSARDPNSYK